MSELDEIINDLLVEFGHPSEYMMRPVQEEAYKAAKRQIKGLLDKLCFEAEVELEVDLLMLRKKVEEL